MQRAGRSISHPLGLEELFAKATCAPRNRGLASEKVQRRARVYGSSRCGARDCVWIVDTRAAATRNDSGTTATWMLSLPFPILLSFAFFHSFTFSFLSSLFTSSERAYAAKIALFLYNAHIRRSYCNLVRSRFRVIGEEKYFHGCGAPTREREREFSLFFLVSPPSPSEIFLGTENHAQP